MGVFDYGSVLTSIVVGLAGIASVNRRYHAGFAFIGSVFLSGALLSNRRT